MSVPRYKNDASHSRYYVFRHKTEVMNDEPVNTMENLHGEDGQWFENGFKTCKLFSTQGEAQFHATEYKDGFTYCVGKVFVEVDGYFEIMVMK